MKIQSKTKGFTLIEVIAAVAIIGIITVAIFGLNSANINRDKIVKEKDTAYNMAKTLCEKFTNSQYDKPLVLNATKHVNDIIDISDRTLEDILSTPEGTGYYTINIAISSTSDTIKSQLVNLYTFNVKVSKTQDDNNFVRLSVSKY